MPAAEGARVARSGVRAAPLKLPGIVCVPDVKFPSDGRLIWGGNSCVRCPVMGALRRGGVPLQWIAAVLGNHVWAIDMVESIHRMTSDPDGCQSIKYV